MSDFAPYLESAFDREGPEGELEVAAVEGRVPPFVRGTYYLNGPGRFAWAGRPYRHWLDGDGKVVALRLGPDGVRCRTRFVRGTKFVTEQAAGRAVFRAFGTACADNRLKRGVATESPLNVSVHPYQGRLLAFGEQSLPWELDPETLATRGPFDFGGQLTELSPFSAHPRIDPATGELFNFGVAFSPRDPRLHLYRFGPDGELVYRKLVALPYPCSVHDFALSRRYAVFYLSPYVLDLDGLLRQGRTTMDCLSWQPDRGSRLLWVDRETGAAAGTVALGGRYCLHLLNAFEEGETLTVDVLEFPRPLYDQYQVLPELFHDVPRGGPVRFVVDPANATLLGRRPLAYDRAPDFPTVTAQDGCRPYRHFWMLGISAAGGRGRKFFDQLVRGDWSGAGRTEIYQAPPDHYFGGQPAFVADPDDARGGVVVCPLFDARAAVSSLALFPAFAVTAGPVAVIRLNGPLHLGFHAEFAPQRG